MARHLPNDVRAMNHRQSDQADSGKVFQLEQRFVREFFMPERNGVTES